MTYYVSSGTLNPTHSLTHNGRHFWHRPSAVLLFDYFILWKLAPLC